MPKNVTNLHLPAPSINALDNSQSFNAAIVDFWTLSYQCYTDTVLASYPRERECAKLY